MGQKSILVTDLTPYKVAKNKAQAIDASVAAYPVSVTSSSSSATSGGFTGPAGNVCSCARRQTAGQQSGYKRREGKSLEQQVIDASVRAWKNNNNPWYDGLTFSEWLDGKNSWTRMRMFR